MHAPLLSQGAAGRARGAGERGRRGSWVDDARASVRNEGGRACGARRGRACGPRGAGRRTERGGEARGPEARNASPARCNLHPRPPPAAPQVEELRRRQVELEAELAAAAEVGPGCARLHIVIWTSVSPEGSPGAWGWRGAARGGIVMRSWRRQQGLGGTRGPWLSHPGVVR